MSKGRGKPLGEKALRSFIRKVFLSGDCREDFHAEHGHPERGIFANDVVHGLKRKGWSFAEPPNYDHEHRSWEYLIRTEDVEGNELHIKVAAFPRRNRLVVITRW